MESFQRRLSPGTVIATVALVMALGGTAVAAQRAASAPPQFIKLSLQNGWSGGPYSTATPAVTMSSGLVVLEGAMSRGTNLQPFTLPPAFRPHFAKYLTVDLCNGHPGRLMISPSGVATIQVFSPLSGPSDAHCFTSLDGVSFAP